MGRRYKKIDKIRVSEEENDDIANWEQNILLETLKLPTVSAYLAI